VDLDVSNLFENTPTPKGVGTEVNHVSTTLVNKLGDVNSFERNGSKEYQFDVPVRLEGSDEPIMGLVDSGTQISVLRRNCLPINFDDSDGSPISLVSAFGQRVKAVLLNLTIRLQADVEEEGTPHTYVPITVAVTDELTNEDLLLTFEDYLTLKSNNMSFVPNVTTVTNSCLLKDSCMKMDQATIIANRDFAALPFADDFLPERVVSRVTLRSDSKSVDKSDEDDLGVTAEVKTNVREAENTNTHDGNNPTVSSENIIQVIPSDNTVGSSKNELASQQTTDPTLDKLRKEVGRSRSPYFVNPTNGCCSVRQLSEDLRLIS
jgi:hypothetical protein